MGNKSREADHVSAVQAIRDRYDFLPGLAPDRCVALLAEYIDRQQEQIDLLKLSVAGLSGARAGEASKAPTLSEKLRAAMGGVTVQQAIDNLNSVREALRENQNADR